MTNSNLTGGPAFPTLADNGHAMNQDGMTLRDWFAGKSMQGIWSNAAALAQMPKGAEAKSIASVAYEMADAMLEERSK